MTDAYKFSFRRYGFTARSSEGESTGNLHDTRISSASDETELTGVYFPVRILKLRMVEEVKCLEAGAAK